VLGKTTAKTFDSVKLSAYTYTKNTTNRVYGQVITRKTASFGETVKLSTAVVDGF